MKFRKFKKEDIRQIAKIKVLIFSKFNKNEYWKKGAVTKYLKKFNLKKSDDELLEAFEVKQKTIFFVVEEKNNIVGYIKGRKNRIENLFILGKYHKKGIGTKLVEMIEQEFKKEKISEMKVDSSIYATNFYKKLGYKKTTGIRRNIYDLKVQPMKKKLG